jgi:3',5'-cyclic AMP phosphodiesterase CpdA
MIIAHISDTHLALDAPDGDRRLREFADTVADINTLDPAPDVIVHTGDIVHNGRPDEYALAAEILAKAAAPVHVLPGNKDQRENLREAFALPLARDSEFIQYAADADPLRLVFLDTLSPASNKGGFCSARLRQLAALIESETTKPVAVFMHHPPFEVTVGPDPVHFDPKAAMSALQQTLQRPGRVVAAFCGHVHRAATGHVGDIPVTVVPCIATALRKGEYATAMKSRPIYYLHRYDPGRGFVTQTRIVGDQQPARRTA